MPGFTPMAGLAGGALIGLAAVILLLGVGRIAGISGIFSTAIRFTDGAALRWLFVAGLVIGAFVHQWLSPGTYPVRESVSGSMLAIAGLLVGFGTGLGNGCTSGHGVCGLGRLSPRSLVATVIFMLIAMITVFITRSVLGWAT